MKFGAGLGSASAKVPRVSGGSANNHTGQSVGTFVYTLLMELLSKSPQMPSRVVGRAEVLGFDEIDARVERVRAGGRAWSELDPTVRAEALRELARHIQDASDELTQLIVAEVGKPQVEARGEVARCVAVAYYLAEQALAPTGRVYPAVGSTHTVQYSVSRPRGVAAAITPWNFPLAIPLWKIGAALAAGNSVVFKPAPEAIATATALIDLLERALPPDTVALVVGGVPEAQRVIELVDVVSFTGSVRGGRAVAERCVSLNIPVQAELGGHNASVILADADIETTARSVAHAAFAYAGQKCTATRRVITTLDLDHVAQHLLSAARTMAVGDPATAGTLVGPLISAGARDSIHEVIERARAAGATILCTDNSLPADGWYVNPTIVLDLPEESALHREEVFGPIVFLRRADSERHAIELVNETDFGLSTAIYTKSSDSALAMVAEIETGVIRVNAPSTGLDVHVPFGGLKDSAYGPPELGPDAIPFFRQPQTVTIQSSRDV